MIIETVRYVADLMGDGSIGLNIKLAAIGLDSTVAGVEDVRPADINAVLNEFDHDIAARRQVPEDDAQAAPYCLVFQAREADLNGWIVGEIVDTLSMPVAVMFVQRDSDTALGNLACGYYIRCAKQVINSDAAGDSSNRERNDIQVLQHNNMIEVSPFTPIGSAVMSRGFIVDFQTRDMDPS